MNKIQEVRNRLAEIKARSERATPGPWKADTGVRGDCVVWGPNGRFLLNAQAEPHWREYPGETRSVSFDVDARDVEFIAHNREDVPALVEALEGVLTAMDELDEARASGGIYTYGQIQQKIREAVEGVLGGTS